MFNYYDERLKKRLNHLKRKTNKNFDLTSNILDLTKQVFSYIKWEEHNRLENH
jgi:hypothetical protein